MFSNRKGSMVLLVVLSFALLLTGCSGDKVTKELIKGVTGPDQVIVGVESEEFTADANVDNATYQWMVEDDSLGKFTNPNSATTKFVANKVGDVKVRVKMNDTVSDWITLEALGASNETTYGSGQLSQFHAIVATRDGEATGLNDRTGYLAVGYDDRPDRKPYAVKATTQGLKVWEKELAGTHGRIYGIQDVVYSADGDKYYLIGYSKITGDISEGYIAKMDNDGEIEQSFTGDGNYDNVYLRSGVAIKDDSAHYTDIIVVGNYDTGSSVIPYLANVTIKENEDDGFSNKEITNDSIIIEGENSVRDYYNLEAITTIGREDEPQNGYLVVGFAGTDRTNSDGILMKLDGNLDVMWIKQISQDQLYNIERIDSNNFMVSGVNGYIAIVDANGDIVNDKETNISNVRILRDIESVDGGYILVGKGVAIKVDSNLDEVWRAQFGDELFGIASSTDDGYYLLAGRKDDEAYVVKINGNDGSVADRVLE